MKTQKKLIAFISFALILAIAVGASAAHFLKKRNGTVSGYLVTPSGIFADVVKNEILLSLPVKDSENYTWVMSNGTEGIKADYSDLAGTMIPGNEASATGTVMVHFTVSVSGQSVANLQYRQNAENGDVDYDNVCQMLVQAEGAEDGIRITELVIVQAGNVTTLYSISQTA